MKDILRHWRSIMDARLRPLGLSQAKWRALLCISKSECGVKQAELASSIGIETPTLARLLDRLQKDGWVKRSECPTDRRAKYVGLTPKADHAMKVIGKTAGEIRREILTGISHSEMERTVRTLAKINRRAERLNNEK